VKEKKDKRKGREIIGVILKRVDTIGGSAVALSNIARHSRRTLITERGSERVGERSLWTLETLDQRRRRRRRKVISVCRHNKNGRWIQEREGLTVVEFAGDVSPKLQSMHCRKGMTGSMKW